MTTANLTTLSIIFLVLSFSGFALHGWAITFRKEDVSYPKTNITGWAMTGLGGIGFISTLAAMAS